MVSCCSLQHPSMAEAAAAQEPGSAVSCFVLWGLRAPQAHEMGNSSLTMCGREDLSARCLGQEWQEIIWYHEHFREVFLFTEKHETSQGTRNQGTCSSQETFSFQSCHLVCETGNGEWVGNPQGAPGKFPDLFLKCFAFQCTNWNTSKDLSW